MSAHFANSIVIPWWTTQNYYAISL